MTAPRRPRSAPAAPLADPKELTAYSEAHLAYELNMLFGSIGSRRATIQGNHAALLGFIQNARVEAFANHLRNLIVFLYPDEYTVLADDVSAHHFIDAPDSLATWVTTRGPLSSTLRDAKTRADKEMAHLTIRRLSDGHPDKAWDLVGLGDEIRVVLRSFIGAADKARISPEVAKAVPTGPL